MKQEKQEKQESQSRPASSSHVAILPTYDQLIAQRDALLAANNRLLEERRAAMLHGFLVEKARWSLNTFGPGPRTRGISQHIEKELKEIEKEPYDLEEWIDVFMLATDGFWRAWRVDNPTQPLDEMADRFTELMVAKHQKNVARKWTKPVLTPEQDPQDVATEHDRSLD